MDAAAPHRTAAPIAPTRRRVALVHDWLTGMRGGEKCLDVLCRAFPTAELHTLLHRRGALAPTIEAMAIRTSALQKIPGIDRHYRKLLPLMPLAARGWNVGDVDLVVSLSHCVAKSVRVPVGVPHVSYCFTPMRYAWDGRDAYLESWRGKPIKQAAARLLLNRLRAWDRDSAKSVTHFIAISKTIQDRIRRCYGRESVVIEPPVDAAFYTPTGGRREDFYLVVSALVPYKKVEHAVEACSRSGRRLVVIGSGPDLERLRATAGPTVEFQGWQPDEVIRDHYRRCRALLFPGEEDFGIVPIEALACGAPVIALGRGGAAENVDGRVGATYSEPGADPLLATIESWEAAGSPHDPDEGRRRTEALDLTVFRSRLLGYLDSVLRQQPAGSVPAPHLKGDRRRSSSAAGEFAPPR